MPGPFEWNSMESARLRREQQLENSARLARAYARFTTYGWGEFVVNTVHWFGASFVDMPAVSHAWSLTDDVDLIPTRMPRTTGGVYRWHKNQHDLYVGAWVCFHVETASPYIFTDEDEPNYTIHHHMSFEGHAMKDLPEYALDL